MKKHPMFFLVAGVLFTATAGAQQPTPVVNTEIYLAAMADLSKPAPLPLVNISNNLDYDSQPSFTPDGKSILFSSKRDGQQYDIWRYDIETKQLSQVTHTPENENSPLVTPDGKTFSVVRTEMDKTQRLWRFNLDGSNPQLILENVKPVGYHAWIDATHVALFVLGANREPATLQIADTTTGKAEVVDTNIGRTLVLNPRTHHVTFVSKKATPWTIDEIQPDRSVRAILPLGDATRSVEDFVWDPTSDGRRAIYGRDVRLWGVMIDAAARNRAAGMVVDGVISDVSTQSFSAQLPDITRITRLAISPDAKWIAIVAEPVSK
jgi:dipeptidyl aminopeptidase/acylaminoacyl peptidase